MRFADTYAEVTAKLDMGKLQELTRNIRVSYPLKFKLNLHGVIREMESPVGRVPVVASPLRLSNSPPRLDRIPALGEDTVAILGEIGYSDGEIETLRRDHVI